MRKGASLWPFVIAFLVGCLLTYIVVQFCYLEIDYKVNVVTSLISLMTASIGLYIAITLRKSQTKTSNLHGYLQPKLDVVWKLFLTFSHQVSLNDQIELSEINKAIKEITLNITPLKKMFESFGLDDSCIGSLANKIDEIEGILVNETTINCNIVEYSHIKNSLRTTIDEAHSLFVYSLKVINQLS